MRSKLIQLLKDYSFEDILEIGGLDPIDVLETLVTDGSLDLNEIPEGADAYSDD